jgi:hypothetical protein
MASAGYEEYQFATFLALNATFGLTFFGRGDLASHL